MSASFSSFFHYLLHYPPSHLSSSPLISTVSFCFSHFPIFFVSLILFEFPLFFCLEVDYCYDSPCLNNGTCRSLLNNYTCACTEQFQGKNCEGPELHLHFTLFVNCRVDFSQPSSDLFRNDTFSTSFTCYFYLSAR